MWRNAGRGEKVELINVRNFERSMVQWQVVSVITPPPPTQICQGANPKAPHGNEKQSQVEIDINLQRYSKMSNKHHKPENSLQI